MTCPNLLPTTHYFMLIQHKSVIEIEKQLIRDFSSLCNWFVDNELNIHLLQDKTMSKFIWY